MKKIGWKSFKFALYTFSGALPVLIVAYAIYLFFNIVPYQAYRLQMPSLESGCTIRLLGNNQELVNGKPVKGADCFYQTHIIPNAQGWEGLNPDGRLENHNKFDLAFIEFDETRNDFFDRRQVSYLTDKLKQGRQNYVVTYVHGWRHNADIGNRDVARFRVILAYTRSFLNWRCVKQGVYCNANLVGVYIGWHGLSFHETNIPGTVGRKLNNLIAALSFWSRKSQSDVYGSGPGSLLEKTFGEIQNSLSLNGKDSGADKMLITGHSMGGNMIATLMETKILAALKRLQDEGVYGEAFKPPFGDLVTIINPASEASKWTAIQKHLRKEAGIPDNENIIIVPADKNNKLHSGAQKWRYRFPQDQLPVYISLTSTNDWSRQEIYGHLAQEERSVSIVNVNYDSDTEFIFPWGMWITGKKGREEYTTIGHLHPRYAPAKPRHARTALIGDAIGTSHEMMANNSGSSDAGEHENYQTLFGNGGVPEKSRCTAFHSFMQKSGPQWSISKKENYWDTPVRPEDGIRNISGVANRGAHIQIRNYLTTDDNCNTSSEKHYPVSSATSPFWNVRTFHNLIDKHGGFVSYPLFCVMSQIVLDQHMK